MEPAAQLIVHAAFRHGSQSVGYHLEGFFVLGARIIAQQKIVNHGTWKLGRPSESPSARVIVAAENEESAIEDFFRNRSRGRRRQLRLLAQLIEHIVARFDDAGTIL